MGQYSIGADKRSRIDAQAASGIGIACTRADERIDAAFGVTTCATTRFEHVSDVPMAGLLTGDSHAFRPACMREAIRHLPKAFRVAPFLYSVLCGNSLRKSLFSS